MNPESTQLEPAAGSGERLEGNTPRTPVARKHRTVRIAAALALVVAGTYVLYQRVGTTAQVTDIEFTQNLAGGFLAVGMTDRDPGFIVFSVLERDDVNVQAQHYTNAVAGDFTVAEVSTPRTTWRNRLRKPVIVLVDKTGKLEAVSVTWSRGEFSLIRDGADCSHGHVGRQHRCGAPFADVFDIVADGQLSRVPARVREFLAPYARPRENPTVRVHSGLDARAVSAGLDG